MNKYGNIIRNKVVYGSNMVVIIRNTVNYVTNKVNLILNTVIYRKNMVISIRNTVNYSLNIICFMINTVPMAEICFFYNKYGSWLLKYGNFIINTAPNGLDIVILW